MSPGGSVAASSTPRKGVRSVWGDTENLAASKFPTSASRRSAGSGAGVGGLPPRSPRAHGQMGGGGGLNMSGGETLSDISNASTAQLHGLAPRGPSSASARNEAQGSNASFLPMRPEDLGIDPRALDGALLAKIRSRLTAALYSIKGTDTAGFFAAADKNHDGYLDLAEVVLCFRRPARCVAERACFMELTASPVTRFCNVLRYLICCICARALPFAGQVGDATRAQVQRGGPLGRPSAAALLGARPPRSPRRP